MKNSVLNRSLLGFIASLAVLQISAHTLSHGTVTGSLRDGDTNEPIPFTSVVVLRATDHRMVGAGTTDAEGNFKLKRLPLGNYVVQTTALGYRLQQPAVAFRPLHNRQQLGTLTLESLPSQPRVVGTRQAVAQRTTTCPPSAAAPRLAVRS
ncbi:carboxypeptidase regulatory-like domain-containing protein [Hymenobacter psychrotolerans]|uniref:Carboxypeptidase regulatory-like domain-containing protein n=1 Tax=Hymenobacter psychrotolerans DSM 18569 TaxID=1121959 RepID=A0A1M7FFK9_9BACT|nr:carboxypeptidase regulatory-like domain-containing protein [Hymenobacter psychrotolerans]SHM02743.1 Carboxypeptidase regulatory-like domain-containing protein [Hymenobacter psychrotolerans DSM 18569]